MNQAWGWSVRYVAVIIVVLILAGAIGSMDLFVKTTIFSGKLSAAHLVRFLGYATALAVFWLVGQRATIALQQQGGRWASLQHLILPVVSLVVVASAYAVVLLLLKPFLGASLLNVYNWLFILAIIAAAIWLVMAVLNQSSSLTEAFTSAAGNKVCSACGAGNEPTAKFCKHCGGSLD